MAVFDPFLIGEDDSLPPKADWSHCTVAGFNRLQEAANGRAHAFVWPDEGYYRKDGSWRFNAEHKHFQPLVIDSTLAIMLMTLHDALNPERRRLFEEAVGKGRRDFAALFDATAERAAIAGFQPVVTSKRIE